MLSSAVNPIDGGDSAMPGGYQSRLGPAAGNAPFPAPFSSPRSIAPLTRTPFPQLPMAPPTGELPGRTPFPRLPMVPPTGRLPMRRPPIVPGVRPLRSRRRSRRPLTPEIVIRRRPRSYSSRGRHGVITIPLDNRPTLGLRGSPRRVLEIERVRCHRRRRCSSSCYEYDYDDLSPPVQPVTVVANPIANPCLPPVQSPLIIPTNNTAVAASSALVSNLTQEMIDNLPRQTVHLPPMHLPGSQADANTELQTVVFPAEIINPVDGTLSIIQAHPGAIGSGTANIQPIHVAPIQPQLLNIIPTTMGRPIVPQGPLASPAMAADPLMQRFNQLFQRLNIPQTQPISLAPNPPAIRPTLPNVSQFNPTNNTVNNLPTGSLINTANVGRYPAPNIRPINPSNIGSYRPANIIPSRPLNIAPSGPAISTPYAPANITPYRPSVFTPSSLASNATYRPTNIAPSNSSDIGPYRPANITPYANTANLSSNNPLLQPSFPSGPTPYTSAPSIASSSTFTPFPPLSSSPSGISSNFINPLSSSLPLPSTPYQTSNSTPRSILRNAPSTDLSNTIYTGLNPLDTSSSNDIIRKTTRFT